jgi:uncharacterized protein YdhG (YjbR/CyaY superfamily)
VKKPKTVDDYLGGLPHDARATLERVRASIRAAAPQAEERIAYGMPGYYLDGHPVAYFAGFKQHCSFFPASGDVTAALAKDLERYDVAKGTIRFPIGKPLPAALVKKLVRAKIAENEQRYRR